MSHPFRLVIEARIRDLKRVVWRLQTTPNEVSLEYIDGLRFDIRQFEAMLDKYKPKPGTCKILPFPSKIDR